MGSLLVDPREVSTSHARPLEDMGQRALFRVARFHTRTRLAGFLGRTGFLANVEVYAGEAASCSGRLNWLGFDWRAGHRCVLSISREIERGG